MGRWAWRSTNRWSTIVTIVRWIRWASSYAALSWRISVSIIIINCIPWTCTYTGICCNISKSILTLWASCNTLPCKIVSKEIRGRTASLDNTKAIQRISKLCSNRTNLRTSSWIWNISKISIWTDRYTHSCCRISKIVIGAGRIAFI